MAITIETVPESISFERVQELVRSFGLDTRDLISFSIDLEAVTAEVYAKDAEGRRYFVDGRHEVATHRICIPVVRPTA